MCTIPAAVRWQKLWGKNIFLSEADIVVSMGCNVVCRYIPGKQNLNWGLEDPTGQSDEKFLEIMKKIERNILALRKEIQKK